MLIQQKKPLRNNIVPTDDNLSLMEVKNPFSLYDFLGYFFPGATLFFILIFFTSMSKTEQKLPLSEYLSYRNFKVCLYQADKIYSDQSTVNVDNKKDLVYFSIINENKNATSKDLNLLVVALPFIIISYITGHLISYLSSQTIEYISNRTYGYPSEYLLSMDNPNVFKYFMSINGDKWTFSSFGPFVWRLLLLILFIPISIFIFVIGKLLAINNFIVRPLDQYLITCIESKIYSLSNLLHIQNPPINLKFDFHRIIMHFVFLHQPESQRKTDNYIALYGLLRSITFIGCLYFDLLIFMLLIGRITLNTGWSYSCLALLVFLTIISYMAYIKFYRRYTLENYMSLLSYEKLRGFIYKDDNAD